MSGFGGFGNTLQNLQQQPVACEGGTGLLGEGVGATQPDTLGQYNTLSQDMSRGQMGSHGFPAGHFNYQPRSNPFIPYFPSQPMMPNPGNPLTHLRGPHQYRGPFGMI